VAVESICATLIVVVLVCLSLYFGRQQQQSLRWLRGQTDLSLEDRSYHRRQAWLRLINCGLMLLLAFLVGVYYLVYNVPVTALAELQQARAQRNEVVPLTPEELQLRRVFAAVCLAMLVILMTIVFLVAADIWAIRRYGRRHLRKINDDRRAMIDGELSRMRSERNGHV
jgi:ABC-type Fe3+ transport system permease subunit